jgi:prepilin-type processing-associated H-X9-DG protein
MAYIQYTQDYDEHLVPQVVGGLLWAQVIQAYLKNSQVYICPSERRRYNSGTTPITDTNYGYNAHRQPAITSSPNARLGGKYKSDGTLEYDVAHVFTWAGVEDASGTFLMGDAVVWSSDPAQQKGGGAYWGDGLAWINWQSTNPAAGANTTDPPDPRHLEGANFVYLDGHVKWHKTPVARSFFTTNSD